MTTAADRDAALAEQIRAIVTRHYPGLPAVGLLVRELAAFTSGHTATQIERHARPGPWPPRRPRVDEAQSARRQREQEARSA